MYHDLKHIAPYLHEIVYDDYRKDTEYETTKEAEAFGCSSVRCGDYYGRNFDYVYNDTPEFVVRVKANEKLQRHESIGIATHFGLREKKLLNGQYHKQLELVPNLTLDGINDAGVICSTNVVSMEPNQVEIAGQKVIPETNPGKEDLHVLFIPRFVLDNANSVDDAVNKLKQMNIMGNLNNEMNIHTMIADKNKTVVVEFFHLKGSNHNHFDVVEQTKVGKEAIMTNHYLNNGDNFVNDEKFGNERLAILQKGYDSYSPNPTFDGMVDLMKTVKFSKAYQEGKEKQPMQPSDDLDKLNTREWYSEKVKQTEIANYDESSAKWQEIFAKMAQLKIDYQHKIREEAKHDFWITTHNTTYHWDWTNNDGLLSVIVQEQYNHNYQYHIKITPPAK